MSQEKIKQAIADKQLICPVCEKSIQRYDKYVDKMASIWDGAGDSTTETAGCKVTLICGNDNCSWQERTDYWDNYLL